MVQLAHLQALTFKAAGLKQIGLWTELPVLKSNTLYQQKTLDVPDNVGKTVAVKTATVQILCLMQWKPTCITLP
jgi:hypothetical protein